MRFRPLFVALILGIAALRPSSGAAITLSSFDYPGQTNTQYFGVNNNGQIAGGYGPSYASFAFIIDTPGQTGTLISYPSALSTGARGIDDAGDMIGQQFGSTSAGGFFRSANGVYSPLMLNISGEAISFGGQIAVSAGTSIYVKNSGGYSSFSIAGSTGTTVTGIDDNLNMVGFYYGYQGVYSFYRTSAGNFITINIPGSQYTEVEGMNSLGQVVGAYYDGTSDHGFLWNLDGSYVTFDYAGALDTVPLGINDNGEIVGFYFDSSNQAHGFVGSAVPEPSTWGYFALALPVALLRRFGRSN